MKTIDQNEMDMIYEKLQKLADSGESLDSYPTGKVQNFENMNKMHDEIDNSQEDNMAQLENIKECSLSPSDMQSIIAEVPVEV